MKRIFLIILDGLGVGELPDAAGFGDVGANTLRTISASPNFNAPNLIRMGLGNISGVDFLGKEDAPTAAFGRLGQRSAGKDTTVGHWEIAGVVTPRPLPTYPSGFPTKIISAIEGATGRKIICNRPYSGTAVLTDFGQLHMDSGALIVYTSADSVLQIAAHESIVHPAKLYEYCKAAREILVGEHGVGRVIARPFVGEAGAFARTANRKDFSLPPPAPTVLDALVSAGYDVIAMGKVDDIFAGQGITDRVKFSGNTDGMERLLELAERDFCGLCFCNLVDFDMLYGHRNDINGFAAALSEFDAWLPAFMAKLREDDVVIISADHGCDPGFPGTDHTREYVPLIVAGKSVPPANLGTSDSFSEIAKIIERFCLNSNE